MTDVNTLAKLALRTESLVSDLNGQQQNLKQTLELVVIAGLILDQVKRKIFYGEKGAYKIEKLDELAERLAAIDAFDFTGHEMDMNEQIDTIDSVNGRVVHGIIGVITEGAEMAEALLKYLETGSFDTVNLIEECADNQWYATVLQDELGVNTDDLYHFLIAKLAARYGDKFSDQAAIVRDIGNEREVMERLVKQY